MPKRLHVRRPLNADPLGVLAMRFHLGAIPHSPAFSAGTPWNALREPTPWAMQLLAFPIGVVLAVVVGMLWCLITPFRPGTIAVTPVGVLLSLVAIVLVHELSHVCLHPLAGRSPHSILGFWPSRVLFYAHYDGELRRNRVIAILIAPLFAISIMPLVFAAVTQVAVDWLAFTSSLNALLACGDILGAVMTLSQIPPAATVRNQGWRTYWRIYEHDA